MGLDMYLEDHHYVGNQWRNPEDKLRIATKGNGMFKTNIDEDNITTIICLVGQWRKANAIHSWFVRNLADGRDDCKPIYVPYESLLQLKEICLKIKLEPDLAPSLLPTKEGFFFGSQEYGTWYMEDVNHTINIINGLKENHEYYYRASW